MKRQENEQFLLTQQDCSGMKRAINISIDNSFSAMVNIIKSLDANHKPDKSPEAIEKEFKDSIRKEIFRLLKNGGYGDMEVYGDSRQKLTQGDEIPEALKQKFDAVDKNLNALMKSIDSTYTDLWKLAKLTSEKGGKQYTGEISPRQKQEFCGFILAAVIGLAVAVGSLVTALHSNTNLGKGLGAAGTAIGGLAVSIFPLLAAEVHRYMEYSGGKKNVESYDVKHSGSKALEGFVEEKGIEKVKGSYELESDMGALFKKNVVALRQSLRELVTELKLDAAGQEKAGGKKAETKTPEAVFVEYLEQREAEIKGPERGV